MTGGGLGGFAPGEWSDDTSMAVVIAEVAATGADLTDEAALVAIASGFLRWRNEGPADIGVQTSAVLAAVARRTEPGKTGIADVMRLEAQVYSLDHPRSAGNGALMRTAGVALAHLDDRDALARAARAVASLTHADPLAGDSCVLWCESIRVAVMEGRFVFDAGLDLLPHGRREQWSSWLDDAVAGPPGGFTPNGFTVTALQAAVAAIAGTPVPDTTYDCVHLQDALHAAVRIGDDTDTVAAIAGGLLGARWGASACRGAGAVPSTDGLAVTAATWSPRRYWLPAAVGSTARGGRRLATWATASTQRRWWCRTRSTRGCCSALTRPVDTTRTPSSPHAGSVVTRRASRERPRVVESRLQDSEDPDANPNLAFVLRDAADAVRGLRAEGKRVLLHCVAAHQRTPSIAVAYGVLLGHGVEESRRAVLGSLTSARGRGAVWDAVDDLQTAPDGPGTVGGHP